MHPLELAGAALLLVGAAFFIAGTLGILRFPDVHTRLHALTKADNLGLGFVVVGLALNADSVADVARLAMVWLLALAASATACQLIARTALRGDESGGSRA